MPLLRPSERPFVEAVSQLVYCNPFLPERLDCEKRALGRAFTTSPNVWSLQPNELEERPNIALIIQRLEPLITDLRNRLLDKAGRPTEQERLWYEDLALYLLYEHSRHGFHRYIEQTLAGRAPSGRVGIWRAFLAQFNHWLELPGITLPSQHNPAHLFACYFQVRRAFAHTFAYLVGGSMPAARLRAAVWQSIFTHNLRRYYRGLYQHMVDYPTLITGESGTGKELVARAIGRSRYVAFDPQRQQFTDDFAVSFSALNLSAMSPTLIESELFGHKRGSFTGAVADRVGWLEACPAQGTVFLDEVGELDPAVQVKLLRVLQDRTFSRLGDTATWRFKGKIIAATNRDLPAEIEAGRFRPDFYYRLCADQIRTPALRQQLADAPADLEQMISFVARRVAGDQGEQMTGELITWIDANLGRDYPWPGNFRELEQCVRNLVIRGEYKPSQPGRADPQPIDLLLQQVRAASLDADQLLTQYCAHVYARCGSYLEAARKLNLDRRTVAHRVKSASPA